jgi:biotin carboxyl carrier protein
MTHDTQNTMDFNSAQFREQINEWLQGTQIQTFELSGPETRICIHQPQKTERLKDRATFSPTEVSVFVNAGSVGIVQLAHPLRDAPFVHLGERVQKNQILALLQIGQIFIPVRAPHNAFLETILVAHRSTVGYGTHLMILKKDEDDAN